MRSILKRQKPNITEAVEKGEKTKRKRETEREWERDRQAGWEGEKYQRNIELNVTKHAGALE